MRNRVARSTLRAEVYLEAGYPTAAAQTVQTDPIVNQMLNRMERQLALKHSWPMQQFEVTKTFSADQQYTTLPTTMEDFTKINSVWCLFGQEWLKMEFGITPYDRSLYSSTMRSSPMVKWDLRRPDPDPDSPQIEGWPISATDQTLRFIGEEVAGAMTLDASLCVLDGDALVQAVAGELIAKKNPEEARLKLANADSIIRSIMARQKNRKKPNANMAMRPPVLLRAGIDYIPPTE
jgi:hypothetical protein